MKHIQDKLTYNEIKKNAQILGAEGKFKLGNAVKLLTLSEGKFDVIYIDPPYDSEFYEKSLTAILEGDKINDNAIVILEHKSERKILTQGFEIIKSKQYADKTIDFLRRNKTA